MGTHLQKPKLSLERKPKTPLINELLPVLSLTCLFLRLCQYSFHKPLALPAECNGKANIKELSELVLWLFLC